MLKKLALLLLVGGCHKGSSVASNGSATSPGSDMRAAVETSGSTATGSAAQPASAVATGAAMPPALVELDKQLTPVMKLEVHPRIVELAKQLPDLTSKVEALAKEPVPTGVDGAAWTEAVGQLKAAVDGIGMCTQDLPKYNRLSDAGKNAADDGFEECANAVSERLARLKALIHGPT